MTHAQTMLETPAPIVVMPRVALRLVECMILDDIDGLTADDVETYVYSLRRHEQHEHYLCDEIDEDVI